MTLLFAGHDTTSSSITFMFYELSKNPELLDDPVITPEMIFDETLRMYPPAYIGPRRSVNPYEFAGVTVPGKAHVNYCSWARATTCPTFGIRLRPLTRCASQKRAKRQ